MEESFVTYAKLNPVETKEGIVDLLNTVKKYSGEFVFLWHNSAFNSSLWKPYESVYEDVLAMAKNC